jgi:kynurenine formamidase
VTRIIDLTHPLGPDANVPPGLPQPTIETVRTMASHGRNSSVFTVPAHSGTHLDAPWHVSDTGGDINSIGLDRLIGPAVVWAFPQGDVPGGIGPDELAGAAPKMQRGDAVLLSTGWGRKYGTPAYHKRPWLTVDGAVWLREHGARLVGMDFANPEQPPSQHQMSMDFRDHHELLDHGVLIVENIADMSALEGQRVRLFVTAAPVVGIDGFPARVFVEV